MTAQALVSPGAPSPGETPLPTSRRRRATPRPIGEYLFAGACAAIGLYTIIGAGFVRTPPGSANVLGPRVFPYLVGVLLLAAAVAVLIGVMRGQRGELEEGEDIDPDASTDWITVAKLSVFFLSQLVLIELIGWPFSVAVLFAGAAWALGAKRWWMGVLIGLGIGFATQLIFGVWLGLSLPAGPILNWIPIFNG